MLKILFGATSLLTLLIYTGVVTWSDLDPLFAGARELLAYVIGVV